MAKRESNSLHDGLKAADKRTSALLAELEAKDDALRAIAFHVSAGGYNADSVDADVFKQKIIDGINGISDVLIKRADAADRNMELHFKAIEVERDLYRLEREAFRNRIAELERANKSQDDHINQQQDRIDSLEKINTVLGRRLGAAEKRLATPVRLKKVDSSNVPFASDGFNAAVDYCARAIRAAGFTVGDEQ